MKKNKNRNIFNIEMLIIYMDGKCSKSFQEIILSQLLDISPKNYIFLKAFNSEFSYIEVWLTDQNSKPLDIKDKINIILVIN